jgi:hypothetical protein
MKGILNFLLYMVVGTLPLALLWGLAELAGRLPTEVVRWSLVALALSPLVGLMGWLITEGVREWWSGPPVITPGGKSTPRGPSPASHSD